MWPSRNVSCGAANCQYFLPCHMSLGVTSARMPAIHAFWYTRSTLKLTCGGGGLALGNSDGRVMDRPRVVRAQIMFLGTQFFHFSKAQLTKYPATHPDLLITGAAVSADSKQDHPSLWMTLESGCVGHSLSGTILRSQCRVEGS